MKRKNKVRDERKPNGFFTRMSDEELLIYCFTTHSPDISRSELRIKDEEAYKTLRKRKLLGKIYSKINAKGYLKNWDNFKAELQKAIEANGGVFPTDRRLEQLGYGYLARNIYEYHGGTNAVRKKMGHHSLISPYGQYKSWKVFEKDMKKAIKNNGGQFPTQRSLEEIGFGFLSRHIMYHGGFHVVREKMGYKQIIKPKGFLKDWDNFRAEINSAIKKNVGEFPSYKDLARIGYGYLRNHLTYHGGMAAVRARMDYDMGRKYKGYYADWSNFKDAMDKIIKANGGEFPSHEFISKYNSMLAKYITYHGGMAAVREKIGYNQQVRIKLARQLEEIADQVAA